MEPWVLQLWQVQAMWWQNWVIVGAALFTAGGAVFTAVAAIAVWRQLPLLYGQLDSLNKTAKSQSYQNLVANENAVDKMFADDPSLYAKYYGGTIKYPERIDQKAYWAGLLRLGCWENAFVQHELGTIPERSWRSWERYIANELEESVVATVWRAKRDIYDDDFNQFVEALLARRTATR